MHSDPVFFSFFHAFLFDAFLSSLPYFFSSFAESSWHAKSHFESTSVKESRGEEQQKGNNLRGARKRQTCQLGSSEQGQKGAKNGGKKGEKSKKIIRELE